MSNAAEIREAFLAVAAFKGRVSAAANFFAVVAPEAAPVFLALREVLYAHLERVENNLPEG